jgi:hypothetical protein
MDNKFPVLFMVVSVGTLFTPTVAVLAVPKYTAADESADTSPVVISSF